MCFAHWLVDLASSQPCATQGEQLAAWIIKNTNAPRYQRRTAQIMVQAEPMVRTATATATTATAAATTAVAADAGAAGAASGHKARGAAAVGRVQGGARRVVRHRAAQRAGATERQLGADRVHCRASKRAQRAGHVGCGAVG